MNSTSFATFDRTVNRPKTEQKQKTIHRPITRSGKLSGQQPLPKKPLDSCTLSKLALNFKKAQQPSFSLSNDPWAKFSSPSSPWMSKRALEKERQSPQKQVRYAIPILDKKYTSLKDDSLFQSNVQTTSTT